MNRAPKILHVLRSTRAEGTVKLVLDLAHTPEAVHEIFVLEAQPAEMTAPLRRVAGWMEIASDMPGGRKKFGWMVRRVRAVCLERKPDVVICWSNGFGAFVLLGAALAGVRGLITHAGNPPTPTAKGRAHTVFTAAAVWALRGRMVCCSHYVAGQFARAASPFASILSVVYNCVPLASVRASAEEGRSKRHDSAFRLVMVATLEPHKDHATLLRAMPEVVRALPGAGLVLVGDGSLRETLRKLSASLGLETAVEFLGSRHDVPEILGRSDLFVFSTTPQEGLGTVLIEAMAAGLPVVASDVPACREVLAGGQWGTLVPAADAGALASALITAAHDAPGRNDRNRREHLQRYTPSRMIAGYLAEAG